MLQEMETKMRETTQRSTHTIYFIVLASEKKNLLLFHKLKFMKNNINVRNIY